MFRNFDDTRRAKEKVRTRPRTGMLLNRRPYSVCVCYVVCRRRTRIRWVRRRRCSNRCAVKWTPRRRRTVRRGSRAAALSAYPYNRTRRTRSENQKGRNPRSDHRFPLGPSCLRAEYFAVGVWRPPPRDSDEPLGYTRVHAGRTDRIDRSRKKRGKKTIFRHARNAFVFSLTSVLTFVRGDFWYYFSPPSVFSSRDMFVTKPKWVGKITVEPMLFLYFVTLAISTLVSVLAIKIRAHTHYCLW